MNLENLFRWTDELEILDGSGKPVEINAEPLVLYQRVVGDADLKRARNASLRESKKLRKLLRDKDSGEHQTMILDYEDLDNDGLKSAIVLAETRQIRQRARKEAALPAEPKEPSEDASTEERENYLAKLDAHDDKVNDAIDEETEQLVKKRRKELKRLHRDTLVDIYIEDMIEILCVSRMMEVFNSWCAYLGTYVDKARTKRAFRSYESFENAATELKEQIIGGYIHLELHGEDLKK